MSVVLVLHIAAALAGALLAFATCVRGRVFYHVLQKYLVAAVVTSGTVLLTVSVYSHALTAPEYATMLVKIAYTFVLLYAVQSNAFFTQKNTQRAVLGLWVGLLVAPFLGVGGITAMAMGAITTYWYVRHVQLKSAAVMNV